MLRQEAVTLSVQLASTVRAAGGGVASVRWARGEERHEREAEGALLVSAGSERWARVWRVLAEGGAVTASGAGAAPVNGAAGAAAALLLGERWFYLSWNRAVVTSAMLHYARMTYDILADAVRLSVLYKIIMRSRKRGAGRGRALRRGGAVAAGGRRERPRRGRRARGAVVGGERGGPLAEGPRHARAGWVEERTRRPRSRESLTDWCLSGAVLDSQEEQALLRHARDRRLCGAQLLDAPLPELLHGFGYGA